LTSSKSVPNLEDIQGACETIIKSIGEDPLREGLLKTPYRVAKSFEFLTKGYREDPNLVINEAIFHENSDEMVVVKDIEIYSLCEHHMLPFIGKAHVAYIPNGKIIGLSKIAHLVEIYTRRLQVQERLTIQIANTIQQCLNPLGVAVVIKAKHLCMQMRGVEKQNSSMITSSMLGVFREDSATRSEFFNLLKSDF
jgi:GTP cyclohydrolase I